MHMKSNSRQLRARDYINDLAASGHYHFLSSDASRTYDPARLHHGVAGADHCDKPMTSLVSSTLFFNIFDIKLGMPGS